MNELQIYGIDGLFHKISKASAIINGRYAILSKGNELNTNNLLSGLDLPINKYPGIFCLPPISELESTINQTWENFSFRLLFLCTTNYTGDNQIKSVDFNTNSSLHTVPMDWSDMKDVALAFMNALEKVKLPGFRIGQKSFWRIIRITGAANDNVSGVLVSFGASIASECEFTDIDIDAIELPTIIHEQHFH